MLRGELNVLSQYYEITQDAKHQFNWLRHKFVKTRVHAHARMQQRRLLSRLKCFVFSVTYRKHFDVDLFAVNLPARLSRIVMPKSIVPFPTVSKMALMENLRGYFARKLYYKTDKQFARLKRQATCHYWWQIMVNIVSLNSTTLYVYDFCSTRTYIYKSVKKDNYYNPGKIHDILAMAKIHGNVLF